MAEAAEIGAGAVQGLLARLGAPIRRDWRRFSTAVEARTDPTVDFATFCRDRSLAAGRLALLLSVFCNIVWLPTDFWVFADDVALRTALPWYRLGFVVLALAAYGVASRVTAPQTNLTVISLSIIIAGYSFGALGMFAPPDTLLVTSVFFMPSVVVMFLSTLRRRILFTSIVCVTAMLSYYLPHPEYMSFHYNGFVWAFLVFGAFASIFFGHIRYLLEERNFFQHLQIQAHAKKLEELDRMKDSFLATVSHELRTPLNAILGLTEVVLEEPLPASVKQHVRTIDSSGEVLLSLINDILDLAKIKSGPLELEAVPVSVYDVVETSVSFFAVACQQKGLTLSHYVSWDVPTVLGDPRRLSQILLNLIGNAVKFTTEGEVQIVVRYEASASGEALLAVSVSDTGPGIAAAKRDTIFDEFTQADTSTTRKFGGTGLGLPIVRRLARRMGGEVILSESPTKGSVFTLRIPVKPVAGEVNAGPVLSADATKIAPVVVVCAPHPLQRRHLTDALAHMGLTTESAANPDEAARLIWKAGREPRWVLLTDASITPELLRRSALTRPSGELIAPVVLVMPAMTDGDTSAAYQKLGVRAALQSPVQRLDLRDAFQQLLAPAAPPPAETLPPPNGQAWADDRSRRILIVDDVLENRLLLGAYLKDLPLNVEFAENGIEGLARFSAKRFDAVFLDIEMPEMDGYTAVGRMRALEKEKRLRPACIVAITAHGSPEYEQRSMDAGFNIHLTKPLRKRDFLEVFERMTSSTPAPRPAPLGRPSGSTVALGPAFIRLRNDFIAAKRAELPLVQQWMGERKYKEIRRIGHNLRGTCGIYGLSELAEVGTDLEIAASREDENALRGLVLALERALSKIGSSEGMTATR
jgi:signal transduction histidine kinase/CheY-like chemotaxis protein